MRISRGGSGMNIFVDTEIWAFAQKIPDKARFETERDFKEAMKLHKEASPFLEAKIGTEMVFMTTHQLAELFHVLAFRGLKLPKDFAESYIKALTTSTSVRLRTVTPFHIERSIEMSRRSGIHIWDFICIIPLIEDIERIYTCDQHFLDPAFAKFGIEIDNPLSKWLEL